MMVTVIDISTLFKEKRGKAFELITKLSEIIHDSLTEIYKWWYIQEELIFVEMEAPSIFYKESEDSPSFDQQITWKNFCKKKFTSREMKSNIKTIARGI